MEGCLAIEILIDFVDGHADQATRERVEQHASGCDDCRAALSSLATSGTPAPSPRLPQRREVVLTAGSHVGRYVIAHEIGAGGMGAVYAASDPELGRRVAVKVLRHAGDPSMQTRLRREAQAMARLAHPNVVAVHDVGAVGDQTFLAMELVDGDTLARWLATPRPLRAVFDAFRAAGRGLAAAHAAGIIHRDFKPENVLIGRDGRVCVGDFGLAHQADSGEVAALIEPRKQLVAANSDADPATAHTQSISDEGDPATAPTPADGQTRPLGPSPTGPNLTVPGLLVGTPYYMAPELYEGEPASERSDQFSFCVALASALGGQRPAGATFDPVATANRLREQLDAHRLPRRIRAAIARGLSIDPAARFSSLDELLVELAPPDRTTRWMIATTSALVAGIAGLAWYGAHAAAAPDQRCTGAAAAYAATWTPQQRTAITAAFTATHAPFADITLRHVTDALDQYATRWTDAHTQACRATRILGEQTEATLGLRMACLERQRQETSALINVLTTAGKDTVAHAAEASERLPDVALCADVSVLQQVVPPPGDAATRAKLAALTPRLAEAHAKLDTGAFVAGLALVKPIVAEARALRYQPFEAEADYVEGRLETELAKRKDAEASLQAAVLAAEASRHDEVAARARIALVTLIGLDNDEFARAEQLAPFAAAAVARLGGNADLETKLEALLGQLDYEQSKINSAVAHGEKALELAEAAHGPDAVPTAFVLNRLGSYLLAQNHPAQANAMFERALAIYERVFPGHPLNAAVLTNIGNAQLDLGHVDVAISYLRRALVVRRTSLGSEHPNTLYLMSELARALRHNGQFIEALALDRRATELGEHAFGPENENYAELLAGLAESLKATGDYAEATALLQRAKAIFTKAYSPDHGSVWRTEASLGDVLLAQGRYRDAIAIYEQAIPHLAASEDVADALLNARINLASAQLSLHHPKEALAAIEPITSHKADYDARTRGYDDYLVARALWDSGGDKSHVRELIVSAQSTLDAVAAQAPDELHQLNSWLASTPSARPKS